MKSLESILFNKQCLRAIDLKIQWEQNNKRNKKPLNERAREREIETSRIHLTETETREFNSPHFISIEVFYILYDQNGFYWLKRWKPHPSIRWACIQKKWMQFFPFEKCYFMHYLNWIFHAWMWHTEISEKLSIPTENSAFLTLYMSSTTVFFRGCIRLRCTIITILILQKN